MMYGLSSARDYERKAFGENWVGPEDLPHAEDVLVATYPQVGGDGQAVNVYCSAWPARFYTLEVLPGADSMGKRRDGYEIVTGTSAHEQAAAIAKAIADGMLLFRPLK